MVAATQWLTDGSHLPWTLRVSEACLSVHPLHFTRVDTMFLSSGTCYPLTIAISTFSSYVCMYTVFKTDHTKSGQVSALSSCFWP